MEFGCAYYHPINPDMFHRILKTTLSKTPDPDLKIFAKIELTAKIEILFYKFARFLKVTPETAFQYKFMLLCIAVSSVLSFKHVSLAVFNVCLTMFNLLKLTQFG